MSGYTQLTREERYQIYMLGKAGHSQAEMARLLERAKATISRELRRNRGRCGYRPKQAQRLSLARRRGKARSRVGRAVWADVAELLRLEWSPEQISGHLWVERGVGVSPEWIYQHVLADKRRGGALYPCVVTVNDASATAPTSAVGGSPGARRSTSARPLWTGASAWATGRPTP